MNDERSATLSDKAERPEKKRSSAPGFAVKRAVIKSWRVFFWSNQPQKALTCFIIRFVSGPQLADVAGLSPRQFGRVFLSETGQTPAKAVETLRAESARAQIEKTNESIEMIAKSVGFSDPERMRRVFVRSFGNPPQAVRRMSRVEART